MKNLGRAFVLIWKVSKFQLSLFIFLNLLYGLIPPLKLMVMNKLINIVSYILHGQSVNYTQVVLLIAFQCFINVCLFSISHLQRLITTKIEFQLNHYIEKKINLVMDYLPYEFFEYPDFYNRFNRVVKNGSIASKLLKPVKSIISIVCTIISLISIVALLVSVHWFLVLLSFISFIPFLIFNSRFGQEDYSLIKNQTLDKRKANYYKTLLQNKQSIKEIRLFNLTKYFNNKWEELYIKNMNESMNLANRQTKYRISLDIFKYFIYGISS